MTADGGTVYLRGRTGDDPVACLRSLELDSGVEWLPADPVRLLGAGRRPRGIQRYATVGATGVVVFTLGGALWTVPMRGGPRRLPAAGPAADPHPDPAGRRIAYLGRGALRVIGADGRGGRPIARPDAAEVEFGVAAHTAATLPAGPLGGAARSRSSPVTGRPIAGPPYGPARATAAGLPARPPA